MSETPREEWIDVRDEFGLLLFRWSPRLGVLEVKTRRRIPGGPRHESVTRRVPLSLFANPPADREAVDTPMAVVV